MGCICPKCKSNNVIPIMYGYPAPEAIEEEEKGNLKLGGCMILLYSERYFVIFCNMNILRREEISQIRFKVRTVVFHELP